MQMSGEPLLLRQRRVELLEALTRVRPDLQLPALLEVPVVKHRCSTGHVSGLDRAENPAYFRRVAAEDRVVQPLLNGLVAPFGALELVVLGLRRVPPFPEHGVRPAAPGLLERDGPAAAKRPLFIPLRTHTGGVRGVRGRGDH